MKEFLRALEDERAELAYLLDGHLDEDTSELRKCATTTSASIEEFRKSSRSAASNSFVPFILHEILLACAGDVYDLRCDRGRCMLRCDRGRCMRRCICAGVGALAAAESATMPDTTCVLWCAGLSCGLQWPRSGVGRRAGPAGRLRSPARASEDEDGRDREHHKIHTQLKDTIHKLRLRVHISYALTNRDRHAVVESRVCAAPPRARELSIVLSNMRANIVSYVTRR